MDAIYKFVLIGLAVAASALGQSNLTAPVTVFPPAATDPACIRMREQLANGTSFMSWCPPNSIASSFTLQFPKWTGGLTGTTETDDFVQSRRLVLLDRTGRTDGWSFDTIVKTTVPFASSLFIYDAAGGTPVVEIDRFNPFGTPANAAFWDSAIHPLTNNTYGLGTSSLRWSTGYFQDVNIAGTCTGCPSGGTPPFSDATPILEGSSDPTKLLAINVDPNVPASTTYTMIVPSNPGTFAVTDATQTFTAAPTFAASILVSGTRNLATNAAPWNDLFSTNSYHLNSFICQSATTFGTCWKMSTPSSTELDIADPGGTTRLAMFNTATPTSNFTSRVAPSAAATYDLGAIGLEWRTIYVGSVVAGGGTAIDASGNINGTTLKISGTTVIDASRNADMATYKLGGTTIVNASRIFDGTGLVISGLTAIDSSGNIYAAGNQIANSFGTVVAGVSTSGSISTSSFFNNTGSGYRVGGSTVINSSRQATLVDATITTATGGGNDHACFDSAGKLYRATAGAC